jgi:gamma-glutamyl:cysteine ligase YbdK (ATP-grasp superfamily)
VGKEIELTRFEAAEFDRYAAHLEAELATLRRRLHAGDFDDSDFMAGFELEAWLLDRHYYPVPENEGFLARLDHPLVVPELSKFNVELNGLPRRPASDGLRQLEDELTATWQHCARTANEIENRLIMIGILPTVRHQDLVLANISQRNRYHALNEQILERRGGRPLCVDIHGRSRLRLSQPDVMLEAATTSFQVHLQAPVSEISRYYNASLILSAPMVALAANSPFLFGQSLWEETRIPIFEQAVDTGEEPDPNLRRVSFGSGYLGDDPFDYFQENIARFSVLLPIEYPNAEHRLRHLRLHNGTIWRWNRLLIGFDAEERPSLRIEHRVMPAGPTIVDMFANAAVYLGAARFLAGLRDAPEQDLPFETTRENFYRAAREGLDARIAWLGGSETDLRSLLLDEVLPMAREGLILYGVSRDDAHRYLDLVRARVRSGQTGAQWQRAYIDKHGEDFFRMTAAYLEHQRSETPVHEWPV